MRIAVSLRNQAAGSVITRLHGEFIATCSVSVDYEHICNKLCFGVAFLLLCAAMHVANQTAAIGGEASGLF